MPSKYESATADASFIERVAAALEKTVATSAKDQSPEEHHKQVSEVAYFVTTLTAKTVTELNKQVKTFDALSDESTVEFAKKSIATEVLQQFPTLQVSRAEIMPVKAR